jgi:hypothetical protein
MLIEEAQNEGGHVPFRGAVPAGFWLGYAWKRLSLAFYPVNWRKVKPIFAVQNSAPFSGVDFTFGAQPSRRLTKSG